MLTIITPPRGTDKFGQGHYGALRGRRSHRGVDLACYPHSTVKSPVTGIISRLGYPYAPTDPVKGHYRYVEITTPAGYRHRIFYVQPLVAVDDNVTTETHIGIAQNLQIVYGPAMTPHLHYEIIDPTGQYIDPAQTPSAVDNMDS